jgi:hypothetical protein
MEIEKALKLFIFMVFIDCIILFKTFLFSINIETFWHVFVCFGIFICMENSIDREFREAFKAFKNP